ncbi:response regulator [Paenibacillus koleovorans]|uniref:response regulator n=1 Tax=Paenibacillus koleovorans TaxID=121608 RepID=UPI0013E29271|nr:response regulator [Paenibacillus koleovorans]
MRRLLIVDDESSVCERLAGLLPWSEYGVEPAGEAHNGEQAWEIVRRGDIDIVLTDIRMPVLDGLSLAARVRGALPHVKLIVMSAYNDFAYAQEAIRHGVKGYLLKPVIREELEDLIRGMLRELQQEESIARKGPAEKTDTETQLIRLLEQGSVQPGDERLPFGADGAERYVRIVVCAFDSLPEGEPLQAVRNWILTVARQQAAFRSVPLLIYGNRLILFAHNAQPISKTDMLGPLRSLQEQLRLHEDGTVGRLGGMVFGVGNLHRGHVGIAASYNEAVYALSARFFYGTDKILFRQDMAVSGSSAPYSAGEGKEEKVKRAADALVEAIVDRRLAEMSRHVFGFFDALEETYPQRVADIRLQCMEAIFALDRKLKERELGGKFPNKTEAMETIQATGTLSELKAWFKRKMEAVAARRETVTSLEGTNDYVQAASQFVLMHYKTKIMVEDVAGRLHLNPKYFSSLFKRETGENFVDYVNRIRIEKASERILRTDAKIKDISVDVGFSNFSYFNKTFKRVMGVTPLVYRINRSKERE